MNGLEQGTSHELIEKQNRFPWLRKLGWIGFLLFLLKGIIWLVVGYLIVR